MQTSRTLSAEWTRVLARGEAALARAVAQMEDRNQVWAAKTPASQSPKLLDFTQFDDKNAAFASSPRRAERFLAQLDNALGEGEDALRQWLERAEAIRRKLAAWVGRAVR